MKKSELIEGHYYRCRVPGPGDTIVLRYSHVEADMAVMVDDQACLVIKDPLAVLAGTEIPTEQEQEHYVRVRPAQILAPAPRR